MQTILPPETPVFDPSGASISVAAVDAAKSWKSQLPRETRAPNAVRGSLLFTVSLTAYLVTFVWMFVAPRWTGILLATSLNALAIGSLFVVGHDAGHRTLFRSSLMNRIFGRIAMLPSWHPFSAWTYVHNTLHHGWTGFKGRHPDFCPLSKADYDALPPFRRWLERVYRSPLGIGLCYVIEFYGKCLLWPPKDRQSPHRSAARWDRLLIAAFIAVQIVAGTLLSVWAGRKGIPPWGWSLAIVVYTWCLWAYFMGTASYLQHTHPRIAWYSKLDEWNFYHVQLKSSTHVAMPAWIDRLLHNIMDHPAHHLDPTIPMHRLPETQKLLEQQAGEHAVVVPWTLSEFLRTCRVCKLYDYENHCWTDFDGRPTSEIGLHGHPTATSQRA